MKGFTKQIWLVLSVLGIVLLFSLSLKSGLAKSGDIRNYLTVQAPKVEAYDEDDFTAEFWDLVTRNQPSHSDQMNAFDAKGGDEIGVIIDVIIQLGEKIWPIVEKNRPVVNVVTEASSAVPQGIKNWQTLSGWKNPKSKVFRVTYANLMGINVVDYSFRILYTYGGSYKGHGMYLSQVKVIPADLSVAWGYTFNSDARVVNTVNVGQKGHPIAGMEVQAAWSVDTVLKHNRMSTSYFVRGDGELLNLTDGTK